MELRVTPVQLPEAISFNYEELKTAIEEKASEYATSVYTEDQIKFAKTDRANLNKLKKALNEERIRQEREYMQPFNDFKTKVNELIGIIDKPVKLIDTQVKNFEEQQKMKKKDDILYFFESCNYPEWISFEQIFNEKWLNSSVKMNVIEEEIKARLEQISNDLSTLLKLPEFAFEATEVYKNTLDLNKAISEGTRLSEIAKRKAEHEAAMKAQEEARIKAEAEAKARAEAEAQAKAAEQTQPEQTEETQPEVIISKMETVATPETVEPKKEWVNFSALLSPVDAVALKNFFKARNIEFKAI